MVEYHSEHVEAECGCCWSVSNYAAGLGVGNLTVRMDKTGECVSHEESIVVDCWSYTATMAEKT